jgi:hypothetical protein
LLYAAEGVIHEMVMNPGNVDENRALKILTPVSEFY